MSDVVILGGPNGAGKTTAARSLLPGRIAIDEFVNADEIARGLSPYGAERAAIAAGRLMLDRIGHLIARGSSFAFETTCSGRSYVRLLQKCRADGWRVSLLYLWLPSPEAAVARVAQRVREGGHSIPKDVVARRYRAGLSNLLALYLPLADEASIYDNSDEGRVLIATKTRGSDLEIHDAGRWKILNGS